MARRGQRIDPSDQTPEWRAARGEEVKLAQRAAAGDPAARAAVVDVVVELAQAQAAKGWGQDNEKKREAVSELCWRILEWLDATHRDHRTKVERTGWKKLGDFRGESTLATFCAGQMQFIARQYATALGCLPKTVGTPRDDRLGLGGGDADLDEEDGGTAIAGGEPDDGPLPPAPEGSSLTWSQAEIDRVRQVAANPVHRLAFYLLFLAHRMPPVEELCAAAEDICIWPEVIAGRITKLSEAVCQRVFRRNVELQSELDKLGDKIGRLEELERRQANGRHLRRQEKDALVELPEKIREMQASVRELNKEIVHPAFDDIALVLAPPVGKPRNRGTIHGWVKPICEALAPQGAEDEESPCALLFDRGKGSGKNRPGRKRRSAQQPPPSARPRNRRSP
jgi:hypothetical protein